MRLLPLMLLIILGLAGLRGAVATPRWDGPLHRHGLVVGLALEVVLGALLVITIWRRSAGVDAQRAGATTVSAVAVKLRGVLIFVLTAGMIAVVVALFFGLGLHLFTAKSSQAGHPAPSRADAQGHGSAAGIGTRRYLPYPGGRPAVRRARRGAPGRSRAQHLVGQAAPAAGRAQGR